MALPDCWRIKRYGKIAAVNNLAAENLGYWVALSRVSRLGAARFRMLEAHFGADLGHAWHARARELRAAGIGRSVAQAIVDARESVDPAAELARLAEAGVAVLTWHDPQYPRRLQETADAPPVLYRRGNLLPADEVSVAVVGTRRPTDYGRRITADLCAGLAQRGVTVVSGLALGIDARAHEAALNAGGRTIAVLGNGLDTVYPRENLRLAERIIAAGGAIISEFGLGVRPEAANFPRRNRIISGITLGTLITEAGETSGTRWTVYHALEQNREIFCVPGSVYSDASRLTNRLIREGAKLVSEVSDILVEIGLDTVTRQAPLGLAETEPPAAGPDSNNDRKRLDPTAADVVNDRVQWNAPPAESADPEEADLLRHITAEPTHIDDLARACGRPIAEVSGLLTMLELKGLVQPAGTMHYQLAH